MNIYQKIQRYGLKMRVFFKGEPAVSRAIFLGRLRKIYEDPRWLSVAKFQKNFLVDKTTELFWDLGGYNDPENQIVYKNAILKCKELEEKNKGIMRYNLGADKARSDELVEYFMGIGVLRPDNDYPKSYYFNPVDELTVAAIVQKAINWIFGFIILSLVLNILAQWIWSAGLGDILLKIWH